MRKTLLLSLLAAALLGACGGGGDDAPPPATTVVPPSASTSPSGFIAYLQQLVTSSDDTIEPVDTSQVVPLPDDMGEPTKVD